MVTRSKAKMKENEDTIATYWMKAEQHESFEDMQYTQLKSRIHRK